jgi:hypothetical protein
MEPAQSPRKSGVSLTGASFGMLITFLGGIYVGAHPSWFPSKLFNGQDPNAGKVSPNPPSTMDDMHKTTTQPTTAPSMAPSTTGPSTLP